MSFYTIMFVVTNSGLFLRFRHIILLKLITSQFDNVGTAASRHLTCDQILCRNRSWQDCCVVCSIIWVTVTHLERISCSIFKLSLSCREECWIKSRWRLVLPIGCWVIAYAEVPYWIFNWIYISSWIICRLNTKLDSLQFLHALESVDMLFLFLLE